MSWSSCASSLVLVVLLAGCSPDESPGGGFPFDCQPLCKSPDGSLLGSPKDVTVKANDSDAASDACVAQVAGEDGVCPAGSTVERCSCDLSDGSN